MALTTLDAMAALIVVDLQRGTLDAHAAPEPISMNEVLRNAGALAKAFRRHALPVILVKQVPREDRVPLRVDLVRPDGPPAPANYMTLAAELDEQSSDHIITKRTFGAFRNTDLEAYLRGLNVTQVVVAGCWTSFCVESTVRQANECDFHVTIAIDAMTDTNREKHNNSVQLIFPRMGETGTTEEILALLETTRAKIEHP